MGGSSAATEVYKGRERVLRVVNEFYLGMFFIMFKEWCVRACDREIACER